MTGSQLNDVIKPIIELINLFVTPMIAVVGALGAVYCVILGVKFSQAEEPQDREKAKGTLKNAVIGFVLIFIMIMLVRMLIPLLLGWMDANSKNSGDILTPKTSVIPGSFGYSEDMVFDIIL